MVSALLAFYLVLIHKHLTLSSPSSRSTVKTIPGLPNCLSFLVCPFWRV